MSDSRTALPAPARYVQAFTTLDSQISDRQRQLLVEHFMCPGHIATTSELARKIGAKSFKAVNLLYGRLGTLLREEIDWRGEGQKSAVIAWFQKTGGVRGNEWEWHMHGEVAAALEVIGWVPKAAQTKSGDRH